MSMIFAVRSLRLDHLARDDGEERYARAWDRQQYKRIALQLEVTPRGRTGLALGLLTHNPR